MDSIKIHKDSRGNLLALDFSKVPFEPKRFFSVYDVPAMKIRGGHSHNQCLQYLLLIEGELTVHTTDGTTDSIIILKEGNGLFIDKGIWSYQQYMTGKEILIVLCSHEYDESDYIRDFKEFKKKVA